MSKKKPLDVNDPDHVDEVMEEIWRIREEMWAEFNGDIWAMGRYLQEQEKLHPERMAKDLMEKGTPNHAPSEPEAA